MSYSHAADSPLAPEVQRCLHRLAKPWYRPRALHVFRDQVSLAASPNLWATIDKALRDSRYFVLMASRESAESTWVRREVEFWQAHREPETFIIVLTGGEIRWDEGSGDFDWERTDALPPQLRDWFSAEPLWVDLTWARPESVRSLRSANFRDAVVKVAAAIRGVSPDELESDDIRQYRLAARLRRAAIAGLAGLLVASLVSTAIAVQQRAAALQQRAAALRARDQANTPLPFPQAIPASPAGTAMALSSDGRTLATDNSDGAIRLWNITNPARPRPLGQPLPIGRNIAVRTVAFSPDSHTLATGSDNGTIQLWNVTNPAHPQPFGRPWLNYNTVGTVAFSPDRRARRNERRNSLITLPDHGTGRA